MVPFAAPAGLLAQTWIDLGLLNDVLFQFENASAGWVIALQPIALSTFGSLAAMELAWSGIRAALDTRNGVDSVLELVFRKAVFLGFVFWLIQVSPALLPLIVGSFQKAGAIASGIDRLHPSSFLATGVSVAGTFLSQVNGLGLLVDPLGICMTVGSAFVIVCAFASMAGIVLATLIESLIAIAAVPFLLAMAGSRWTARISEGALAYVVRTGVKLFVVYLIAGVANGLSIEWAHRLNNTSFIGPVSHLGFVGSAWALVFLVWSVPRYAAAMVQPSLSFGLSPSVSDN